MMTSNKPNHPSIKPMLPLLDVEDVDLIPLHQAHAVSANGKKAGKRPLQSDWLNTDGLTKPQLADYIADQHNIGVRLGRSILVVDIDPRNFAEPGETDKQGNPLDPRPDEKLAQDFDIDLLDHPTVLTGSFDPDKPTEIQTGLHIYMRIPDGLVGEDEKLRKALPGYKGIDFKWYGGQVVAPGSVHPDTNRYYKWDDEITPPISEIKFAPEALIKALVKKHSEKKVVAGAQLYTPAQLQGALDTINVEEFRDQDKWQEFAMACHAATQGEGIAEFVAWSTSDPEYAHHGSDIAYRWESFDADKSDGITHLTFRKVVEDHGGTVPMDRDDFAEIEDDHLPAPTGLLLPTQMNKSGEKIKDTQTNALLIVLEITKRENWRVRFNTLYKRIEITGDDLPWDENYYPYVSEELLNDSLWLMINGYFPSYKYDRGISAANIAHGLNVLARRDCYNPIVEYLDELKWDGTPRISNWMTERLGAPDDELTRETSSLLFRALVARAYRPGSKFDLLIVLEGKQGTGKSTALATLCPEQEWFTDHPFELLGRGNAADAVLPFLGKWLHEFAEISTLTPATMNKAKAMLSKPVDQFRRPYGRGFEDAPRGFVTVGTTNDNVYLADMTGNRRFLPVALDDRYIDFDAIKEERDQLFAEAVHQYEQDPHRPLTLPQHLWGIAAEAVDLRQADHPWVDILADHLDGRSRVAAKELYPLIGIKGTRGSQETKTLAAVMKALGWSRRKAIRIPADELSEYLEANDITAERAYAGYVNDLME